MENLTLPKLETLPDFFSLEGIIGITLFPHREIDRETRFLTPTLLIIMLLYIIDKFVLIFSESGR